MIDNPEVRDVIHVVKRANSASTSDLVRDAQLQFLTIRPATYQVLFCGISDRLCMGFLQ